MAKCRSRCQLALMHKRKPYKCSICGAEVADLPMPVLKHQLAHVTRRPFARDRREPSRPDLPARDLENGYDWAAGKEAPPGLGLGRRCCF